MERSAREIADSYRVRGSATIEICGNLPGLTEKQQSLLSDYEERFNGVGKPLTDKQLLERLELIKKRDYDELPEGAKTHCKKWLKNFLYNRREELKKKYIDKGNECEESGFTVMAVQLKLGMVYKNTERRRNEFAEGECDLNHQEVIYDNKCSWSLDTFPMFETEIPDPKYWWQLQNYSTNWPAKKLCLCYTLISAPFDMVEDAVKWAKDADSKYRIAERMVYTQKEFELLKSALFPESELDTFVEIPEDRRIKPFYFNPELWAQQMIEKRSNMCKEYIYQLLIAAGYK